MTKLKLNSGFSINGSLSLLILSSCIITLPFLKTSLKSLELPIAIVAVCLVQLIHSYFSNRHRTVKFRTADLAWLLLIVLSLSSVLWAKDCYNVFYSTYMTVLVYLAYKTFELYPPKDSHLRLLSLVSAVILLSLIIYVLYFFPASNRTANYNVVIWTGRNFHYLGSLLVVLLPFVYTTSRAKIWISSNLLLLVMSSFITYKTGSLQVFLCSLMNVFFISVYYFKISFASICKLLIAGMLSGLSIAYVYFTRITNASGTKSLFGEVYMQDNRLALWENTISLIKTSPILGIGRGNWINEIGQYGLDQYSVWINNPYNPKSYNHAHNWILEFISETGIIGIICVSLLVCPLIISLWKKRQLSKLEYAAVFSIANYIFVCSMYGVNYNHFNHFAPVSIFVVCCVSLLTRNGKDLVAPRRSFAFSILLLLGITCFGYSLVTNKCIKDEKKKIMVSDFNRIGADSFENNNYSSLLCKNSHYHSTLGKLFQNKRNTSKALEHFSISLEKNPYDPKILYSIAQVYYSQMDYENALKFSNKSYEICKKYLENNLLRVKLFHQLDYSAEYNNAYDALSNDVSLRINKMQRIRHSEKLLLLERIKTELMELQ